VRCSVSTFEAAKQLFRSFLSWKLIRVEVCARNKLFASHFNVQKIAKVAWRRSHLIKLNTHIVFYIVYTTSTRERSGTVRVSFRSLLLLLLRPELFFFLLFRPHTCNERACGRSHTQTLKSHDNIWCKVGDTYFLLYFCHMLLFKREKIVFYG
jgi:hypothetical protein